MDTIILYICIYIIEAVILHQYCMKLFKSKHSTKYIFIVYFILYGILFLLSTVKSFELNTLVFTIANFLVLILAYDTQWKYAFFHTLIITCIVSFCEIAIIGLSNQFTGEVLYQLSDITYLTILTVASKTLYFVITNTIAILLSSKNDNEHKYIGDVTTVLLNLIPIVSIYITLVLLGVLLNYDIDTKFRYMLSSSALLLIFINILIFFVYHYSLRKNSNLTELELQYQRELDMVEYYKQLFIQNDNQQILIHDIRKHLVSISHLNNKHNYTQINKYINTLLNSSSLQNTVHISDNDMINSIISHYMQICSGKNIDFHTDIRSNSLTFLDYTDLTSLLCNLLDNSVEACSNIPNSFIEVNISPRRDSPITTVNVINTCRTKPYFDKNEHPITTKKGKRHHGLGIKSVERIIAKYDGEMKMYYDDFNLEFHTIIIVKDKNFTYDS